MENYSSPGMSPLVNNQHFVVNPENIYQQAILKGLSRLYLYIYVNVYKCMQQY